jgi:hypothetical protein
MTTIIPPMNVVISVVLKVIIMQLQTMRHRRILYRSCWKKVSCGLENMLTLGSVFLEKFTVTQFVKKFLTV